MTLSNLKKVIFSWHLGTLRYRRFYQPGSERVKVAIFA